MSLPTAVTQNAEVSLEALYAEYRDLARKIHEKQDAKLKEALSGEEGIICTDLYTEGCGVNLGSHSGKYGGISQEIHIEFLCGSERQVKVSIGIEYLTDYFDMDFYGTYIWVTDADGVKKFFEDDTTKNPWFGHCDMEKEEFEEGLETILGQVLRKFGEGEHHDAAKACITLINKKNESLGISR